jgi:hypothetical protein
MANDVLKAVFIRETLSHASLQPMKKIDLMASHSDRSFEGFIDNFR